MNLATATVKDLKPHTLIKVCAECLQASCWLGEFMCDKSRWADVIELPVSALRRMQRENPEYWAKELRSRVGVE